jgi:hypothetical protein
MTIRAASALGLLACMTLALAGCANGGCDEEIEAMGKFLNDPAHLSCKSDADCAVVETGCHTFDRGLCAQAQLNTEAASSSAWQKLSRDLADCESGECSRCLAQVVPGCKDGFCGGRP